MSLLVLVKIICHRCRPIYLALSVKFQVGGGRVGRAACWRAGGRQQIQAGANFTGNVLHLDCGVVLRALGLWVVLSKL